MDIIIQTIGWIGTILIALAYLLVSHQLVSTKSRVYQLMNLLGAIGLGISVFHQRAWPALALQITWVVIATSSIIRSK